MKKFISIIAFIQEKNTGKEENVGKEQETHIWHLPLRILDQYHQCQIRM
jgi:outer membrane protein W